MQNLDEFILEKLKISKIERKYKPKTKEELVKIMIEEIETNGPDCSLNHIDVSNITDMSYLFRGGNANKYQMGHPILSEFDGDVSDWDVSSVTNMNYMFYNSKFNGDISNWDVSSVKTMSWMFYGSKFNGDISNWDVSNVTNMRAMFAHSNYNGDISMWNVSNVTNMAFLFYYSPFDGKKGDISNWDVSDVTVMSNMFYNSKFNGDISKWKINPKAYGHMDEMFKNSPLENTPPTWYK